MFDGLLGDDVRSGWWFPGRYEEAPFEVAGLFGIVKTIWNTRGFYLSWDELRVSMIYDNSVI